MFKVGDLICDISNDGAECTGIIVKKHEVHDNAWWVLWKTGHSIDETLWIYEEDMEVVCEAPEQKAIRGDLDGETITILGLRYRLTKI